MRPLGRRERQRHNQLCRADPAECHQERRESLSRPFHNFSIGRHLWFGPMRSPLQRRVVQLQIECSSDRSETFACDFPQVVFLASDTRRCSRDATLKSEREFPEVVENKDPQEDGSEIRREGRGAKSPANWMIVNTLTTCHSGWRATSERRGTNVDGRYLRWSRSRQDLKCPTRGMLYELTVGEPSKLHLTTRMVTSSSKLSPQKSAAAL